MRALLLLLLLARLIVLLALVAPFAAQQCKKCRDTGLAPCPDEAKHACTGTAAQECSIAAACEKCTGTHTIPCPKCGRPESVEHALARAAHRGWLERVRPLDTPFGRPLARAKSAHFLLTFDIPKVDVEGGETLHGGLHIYLDRMEALCAQFQKELGATDADFLAPTQVYLWSKKADQERASLVLTLQSSSTESKLMGKEPVVTIFYDKAWLHEEFELHQAVVHQVTHCLLSNVWDGIWPGNIRGGWLDEGLAHAYEIATFGGVRHYCYVETDTILDIQRGSWEPPVRAAVERGEAPGFLGVAGKNTTELRKEEQIFAWSYVDYIRRAHPAELGPIARAVKARKPIAEILPERLKISPFQFEEAWRAWVTENYALKERKKK